MADSTVKVPWEKDGEEFDAEKAKSYLTNLLEDKEKLKARLADKSSGSSTLQKELDAAKAENLRLRVQMDTGLTDKQVKRLVGETYEELIEDAESFAEETGIELRSLFDDGTGTPEGETPSDSDDGEKPGPDLQRPYRAPNQRHQEPQMSRDDYKKIASSLSLVREGV